MAISKRVVLHFPSRMVDQPIIYRLVKDHDLVLNILKASVTPKEEGIMVARCTHCGACVVICPTGALALDPKTRMVDFHEDRCTACELCMLTCPPRAMEVHF